MAAGLADFSDKLMQIIENTLIVPFQAARINAADLDHAAWTGAAVASLVRYWSGAGAPPTRHAEARLLWTPDALVVRFTAHQHEPLCLSEPPDLTQKTMNLWDWDVCEIFVAPDAAQPQNYYEFEVAPNGAWLDVQISWLAGVRRAHWEYESGLRAAAHIASDRITMGLWLPWFAFERVPQTGESWHGNLFRCVGPLGPERGYLAWQPTRTPQPNFHVPEAFGTFLFAG